MALPNYSATGLILSSIVATYQVLDKKDFRFLVHDSVDQHLKVKKGRLTKFQEESFFWPNVFYTATFDVKVER